MKATTNLRQLLQAGPRVVAPFILNAMHPKIAEAVGFPAVSMTGAGTAAERGFPDVGLLTMSEMVTNARYIADAVQIPVICDADTGYGNPLNVQRCDAGVPTIRLSPTGRSKNAMLSSFGNIHPDRHVLQTMTGPCRI
jgi:2-methylisocitrate lyase-like PEP mutase family enzyme